MECHEVKKAYIDHVINKLEDLKYSNYEIGESFRQSFVIDVRDNPNLVGEFIFRVRELQPWEKEVIK